MQRLAACSLLVVIAACPSKHPATPPPPVPGVGCPTASGVFVAEFVQPPQGEPGHTGWVMPLYDVKVDSIAGKAPYAPIDAAAAAAAGVPAPPTSIWLVPPHGAACKATIGTYYAAAIDAPPNLAYGVELTGCPPPQDPGDGDAIVLASDAPPSECKVYPPRPIAARLGEVDKQNHWSRPTKETPIPPAFAAIVPAHACTAPDCETLWSILQVDVADKPVAWAGAVNWLTIPAGAAPETQCTWQAETFSGFFIAGPDGTPKQVTDGQDHPLVLTAVLADNSGAHVVLAEGTGEYTTYDLAAGAATVARHLTWVVAGPDAYATGDKIGPECAP